MRGHTYFKNWGFSINEGALPNVHLSWRLGGEWRLFWYVALTRTLRWYRRSALNK